MASTTANLRLPNILQQYASGLGYIIDAQVGASEEIYQGAFVTLDTGDKYLGDLTVPDPMYGLALDRVTGTASNGGATARVLCEGIIQKTITSIAVADIGKPCFATDNQTLTITNDGTDTPIGWIIGVPATGTAIIKMLPPMVELDVFTVTNWTDDPSFDANGTALAATNDVVGTLIKALIDRGGIIQGTVAT